MKKLFAVVLVSVLATGCGINVKRDLEGNVLTSNASPAIQLNIPKSYEMVKSSSGKGFSEYYDGFSGSYDKQEWYFFIRKNQNDYIEGNFYARFMEAGVKTYFIEDVKDKDRFNRDNMLFKGLNYKTYFEVGKLSKQQEELSVHGCFIKKVHRKVLPPRKSRLFEMAYIEVISCNEVMTDEISPRVISGVNMRAIEFMNSL